MVKLAEGNESKDKKLAEEKARNSSLQETNEELMRELEKFKQMASKTDGYKLMVSESNKQKKFTWDALSYVADIKRDRSMFS